MLKLFQKSNRHRKHRARSATGFSQPVVPKIHYELFLFSTFIFICAALLLQFLMSLQTALLLRHFSVSFTYHLFGISYSWVSAAKWSEARIFAVYGLGTLDFFGAGLLLIFILKKIKHIYWKLRLVLVWLAFLMVHTLPLGLLAGTFFFDGFGIAYTWIFSSMAVRGVLAFFVLLVAVYFRPFWMKQFLRTASSTLYLSDTKNRKKFINSSVILPWLAGTIVLTFFVFLHHSWFWLLFLIGAGFILLPLLRPKISRQQILILRNDKRFFGLRYPLPLLLLFIAILWVADYLSKTNF
jgi:hypothetical protein